MTSTPEATAAPVCPRHPDRVSFVSCQRCGRPACPECQRQAPVGVQCVDCVAEQARAARPQRSALGARIGSGRPVVTITMIVACVVSYLLQRVLPSEQWFGRLAFAPFLAEEEPYRMLTTAFLHSTSIVHIVFNMYALWLVGPALEHQLGKARFLALYLLTAVGGSVAFLLFTDPMTFDWVTPVVGASGAVFGLFGALMMVLRRLEVRDTQLVGVIAINFALGFVLPNIAWQAHLGGFVVGVAMAAAYAYAPRGRRTLVAWATPGVVALVLVGLTTAKLSGL